MVGFIIVLLAAFSCLIFVVPPSYAQSTFPAGSNVVEVGVYVLNIGRFDVASGSYTVDFYLSMRCANTNCNMGTFEFMNGRATSIRQIEDTPAEKFWRIEASLYENLNLQDYPFDSHTITIKIEDTNLTKQNLTYVADQKNSGLDSSIVIVGWSVTNWNQEVIDHYYQAYDQTYSQYVFSVTLSRKPTNAFEIFIPVFFLTFIALIAMLMYGKVSSVLESRILLTASVLIAAVLYQFTLDNSIPPLGYLTFVDKFMIATYGIIVSCLVVGIMVLNHHHREEMVESEHIQFYSVRLMPVVTLIVYAILFGFFL